MHLFVYSNKTCVFVHYIIHAPKNKNVMYVFEETMVRAVYKHCHGFLDGGLRFGRLSDGNT